MSTFPPPTHPFPGSSSDRQSVGLPGHCEPCAEIGHVRAHPDLGCGDVGCNRDHRPGDPADAAPAPAVNAPIRIPVTIVIEMTGRQVDEYVCEYGLGDGTSLRVPAKVVVEDVRSYVLTQVQDSAAFGEIGLGTGARAATVTLKR